MFEKMLILKPKKYALYLLLLAKLAVQYKTELAEM